MDEQSKDREALIDGALRLINLYLTSISEGKGNLALVKRLTAIKTDFEKADPEDPQTDEILEKFSLLAKKIPRRWSQSVPRAKLS